MPPLFLYHLEGRNPSLAALRTLPSTEVLGTPLVGVRGLAEQPHIVL